MYRLRKTVLTKSALARAHVETQQQGEKLDREFESPDRAVGQLLKKNQQ